jgi:dienelactone hydrolase
VTFKAAVSFYGYCSLGAPEAATYFGMPRYPWLIANGRNERPVMINSCRKIQDKPGVTLKVIDGAYHALDNPAFRTIRTDFAGNPMLYSASATEQSEQIVKAFLTAQFGK